MLLCLRDDHFVRSCVRGLAAALIPREHNEIPGLFGSRNEAIEHLTPISRAVINRGPSELVGRKWNDNAPPQTETLRLL
jgi:hypothetical protein